MRPGLINFDSQTTFRVLFNTSYTVPETVQQVSPTGIAAFDSFRKVEGGQVFAGFGDAASNVFHPMSFAIKAGDVIACSAVVANVITVSLNGVPQGTLLAITTVGGVLGYHA